MKKMKIRIKLDGTTSIQVEGGQGDDCLAFTRSVETAIGEVVQRVRCGDEGDPLQVHVGEKITETEAENF